MNRWMTALVAAAGGGALIAMSAAQAAAFTPTPSTTTAVTAPKGVSVPTDMQAWIEADGVRMRVADLLKRASFGGAAGLAEHRFDRADMLDVAQPKQALQQLVINPCPRALATCLTQVLYIGPLTGTP